MKTSFFLFAFLLFSGCAYRSQDQLTKVHLTNTNGLTQTLTAKERLKFYQEEQHLAQQPYSKVVRLFGPHENKKILTTYHPNGQLFQRLECENNQAKGRYSEWSPQGQLTLDSYLIGGPAELDDKAQSSWIFHGFNRAFSHDGNLIAEFYYENGLLEKTGRTFHPNSSEKEVFSYKKGELDGAYTLKDPRGHLLGKKSYKNGLLEGEALGYWKPCVLSSKENFHCGKLLNGFYFTDTGKLISKVVKGNGSRIIYKDSRLYRVEYQDGVENGKVEAFSKSGKRLFSYYQQSGLKTGEEIVYDPQTGDPQFKVDWKEGVIEGKITTWYPTGEVESLREVHENRKQGLCMAYYPEGDLMLLEEYHRDKLVRGQYFKKGSAASVSEVANGRGLASLFNPSGHLKKLIQYEEGVPIE